MLVRTLYVVYTWWLFSWWTYLDKRTPILVVRCHRNITPAYGDLSELVSGARTKAGGSRAAVRLFILLSVSLRVFVAPFIMHALLLLLLCSLPLISLAGQCHSHSQHHQKRQVVHPNVVTRSKKFKLVDKYHGSNFFEWAQIYRNFSFVTHLLISAAGISSTAKIQRTEIPSTWVGRMPWQGVLRISKVTIRL